MSDAPLHPVITVRIYGEDKCFGPGVAMLLSGVRERHSLRSAAAALSMSYSKAWKVMRNAERCLGFPLLISSAGGRDGGGATLTSEAERLMHDYAEYSKRIESYSDELFNQHLSWLNEE